MAAKDLRAECDECGATIRTSNLSLAGKTVKCPKCAESVRLPSAEDDDEVVPTKRRKVQVDDDEESHRPAKSKPRVVAVDEDEDGEEPVRPKRKGKKPSPKSNALWYYIGGGVAVLAVAIILGIVLIAGKKANPATGPNGSGGTNPPTEIPKPEMTITPDLFKIDYPPGDTSLDKYDGKVVEVDGLCRWAGHGSFTFDQQAMMYLTTDYGSNSARLICRFPTGIDWSKYCPGQRVKVVGTFRKETNQFTKKVEPFVNDCVVASTDGVMCPTRTAEELATELAAEGNLTKDQFLKLPKWSGAGQNAAFYLTGRLSKSTYPGGGTVQFDTSKGPIEAVLEMGNNRTILANLKVGSEVKLLITGMRTSGSTKFPNFSGQLVTGGK